MQCLFNVNFLKIHYTSCRLPLIVSNLDTKTRRVYDKKLAKAHYSIYKIMCTGVFLLSGRLCRTCQGDGIGLEVYSEVGEQRSYGEEHHWHEEGGEQVDGLAVLDVQDAQAGSGDKNTSHYRHLTDEFFGDEVAREECKAVDGRHPYKDNHTDERDAEAVGRRQNEDGDEVERSSSHEVRVVVVKRTHHGAHHGKRSDAAEQHTGGDALSKVRS